MKKRVLDRVYEEFENKYKNMPQEDMEKDMKTLEKEIEILEKQVAGKEKYSERLQGAAKEKYLQDLEENSKKELDSKKKKLENLKGYSKNKNQISKIIEYKGVLKNKLENTIKAKENSQKVYLSSKERIKEINEILRDEQKISEMGLNEYKDLLREKENAEKEIKDQRQIFLKSIDKIKELEAKIAKCDMAWKTLFVNKSWEDIQLRAMNYTFTKEKNEKSGAVKQKQNVDLEEQQIKEQIGENVRKIQISEEWNLPAKVSAWTKVKNFFKSIPTKIKEKFTKNKVVEEEKHEEQTITETPTIQPKDEFIEGLRRHVDIDYKEAERKAKEQKYIDDHKAKSQKEK